MANGRSFSRLVAESQESIEISFDANYHPPSPGSSAWSMTATNIRIVVMVHFYGPRYFMLRLRGTIPEPYGMIQQYSILQRISASEYSGRTLFPLYIRGGSEGQSHEFKQFLTFDRLFTDIDFSADPDAATRNRLIDPMNHTATFQIDMFAATPFTNTDMGTWGRGM